LKTTNFLPLPARPSGEFGRLALRFCRQIHGMVALYYKL